jgi:hypothetical protein
LKECLSLGKRGLKNCSHKAPYGKIFPCHTFSPQRPPKLWSKEVRFLLKLSADLGTIHVVLILKILEYKSYRVMKPSTQTSKEILGAQAMCGRVRIPTGSP